MKKPALNANEDKVLRALIGFYDEEAPYVHFAHLTKRTRLNRKAVRRACRSLKRKGLAEYERGLFTADGDPFGAGYAASDAGLEYFEPERVP